MLLGMKRLQAMDAMYASRSGAAFCPFKKIVPSVTMEPNSGDRFQSNDYQTFWKNQAPP